MYIILVKKGEGSTLSFLMLGSPVSIDSPGSVIEKLISFNLGKKLNRYFCFYCLITFISVINLSIGLKLYVKDSSKLNKKLRLPYMYVVQSCRSK